MQQGKKKYYSGTQASRSFSTSKGKSKQPTREKPSYPAVDLTKKPVRFYLSKRGKVFPVRVLFQGETKYGDRAKVCLVNERDPEGNAWWCDSENLFISKREALQVAEERDSVPQEDEDQEGEQEGEEGEEEQDKILDQLAEEAQNLGMGY
jgi:hypothetical protein